jgi:hypothetical protein
LIDVRGPEGDGQVRAAQRLLGLTKARAWVVVVMMSALGWLEARRFNVYSATAAVAAVFFR